MLYLGILNPNHQNVVYASTNLANIKKHEAAVHDKKKSFQCRHCPHSAFAKGHLQQYVIILKNHGTNISSLKFPRPSFISCRLKNS